MKAGQKIIGLTQAPFGRLEDCISVLEKDLHCVVISLNDVAHEILRNGSRHDLEAEVVFNRKLELWRHHGRSYLADRTVTDWIPWTEAYGNSEGGVGDYIISDIETVEEVNCLRMEYGEKFKLIAISPPREIRLNRFLKQTGKSRDAFVELEEAYVNRGLGGVILISDIIVTDDDDEGSIRDMLRKNGVA